MIRSVTKSDESFSEELDFFKSRSVITPDCLIDAHSLDHVERFIEGKVYPFKSDTLKSKSGCYLFFDNYRLEGDVVDFLPLYVGKSTELNVRLYRHWASRENGLAAYRSDIGDENNAHIKDIGIFGRLVPDGIIQVAIWFQSCPRELMFLEHELIYKFRPLLNKA